MGSTDTWAYRPIYLLFFLFVMPALSVAGPIEDCDKLAAHPEDKNRKAPGVPWDKLDAVTAIGACNLALKESPVSERIQFQLARSWHKAKAYKQALALYRPLAAKNYAVAQAGLGQMYFSGHGVKQDDVEAVKWFTKAAEQGVADAQNTLGWMYQNGRGISKDETQAAIWYLRAAEKGNADAQNNVGIMYGNGIGFAKNYGKALKWYRKAADQGHLQAQNNIGWMYQHGQGVTKDETQAAIWYLRAAEKGYAPAQNNVGLMYYTGKGFAKNYGKALNWYGKSANQGYAWAQYNIGVMYANGEGVAKSQAEAMKWYRKAAAQGHKGAKQALASLNKRSQSVSSTDLPGQITTKSAGMAITLMNEKTVENPEIVPFTVRFSDPLEDGDSFALLSNGWPVARFKVNGNLGISEFRSRMNLLARSNRLSFATERQGKTRTAAITWKPHKMAYWKPRGYGKKLDRFIRKKATKIGKDYVVKTLIGYYQGFLSYVRDVRISTQSGSLDVEISPMIHPNPFLQFNSREPFDTNTVAVSATVSSSPYPHALAFLQSTKDTVSTMNWKEQTKAAMYNDINAVIYQLRKKAGNDVPKRYKLQSRKYPPLHKQRLVRFTPDGYYDLKSRSQQARFADLLDRLNKSGHKRLECIYGPSRADGTGYTTYDFWHKNVPLSANEYSLLPAYPSWRNLGRQALDKCPPDKNEAENVRQRNWSAWRGSWR